MPIPSDHRVGPVGPRRARGLALAVAALATSAAAGPLAQGTIGQPSGGRASGLPSASGELISLPPGFFYRVLADESTLYSDGTPRPGDADGMGAFPGPNDSTLLCVSHELSNGETPVVPPVKGHYDPTSSGGTSVMLVGPHRELLQAWVSSSGTNRNCAGGVTPWGTWITVEEDLSVNGPYSHGWAFEVDPFAVLDGGVARTARLDNLGRFYREALTIDPYGREVYQTEDRTNGLYYRFVPHPGTLPSAFADYAIAPGRLQALYLPELPVADAANPGDSFAPQWVDVPDPDGDPVATRLQTYVDDDGVVVQPTRFYRGEGSAWSSVENAVYFDCTGGGASGHFGQIWRYEPTVNRLTLVFESADPSVLEQPDNLLVLPSGDLLICEDGSGDNWLRILTLEGELVDFASNSLTEFAGACWRSDPDTLFVNLQSPSITLAIWGPWEQFGQ